MRTTRSPRRIASRMLCVTNRTRTGALPDPLDLVVQVVAGHGVERAERLVHEDDLRVLGQAAGERHAVAHAAGELVRPRVAMPPSRTVSSSSCARSRARSRHPAQLERELDVLARGEPGQQGRVLEHEGDLAATSSVPVVGWSRPATRLSSVLFPQPDAPTMVRNSPAATSRLTSLRATVRVPGWPKTLLTLPDAQDRGAAPVPRAAPRLWVRGS